MVRELSCREMVKTTKGFFLLATCLFLASCGPQVEALTPTVSNTATQLPTATQTPEPTETEVPTPSSTPIIIPTAVPPSVVMPLSGIYAPRTEGNLLVMFDGPQGMFEEIVLPDDGRIGWLSEAISPDREWVVFITGSIDSGDIALNLLNLEDRSVVKIADLLSENFPKDILEVVDQIVYIDPEDTESWDHTEVVLHSLEHYLGDYAWSPDGRSLAFVGQMDGPSTDVYIYEVATGETIRLTADNQLKRDPQWSPDSDTIVFEQIKIARNGMWLVGFAFVGLFDQAGSTQFTGNIFFGWLSEDEGIVGSSGDGVPTSVMVFNFETNEYQTIWSGLLNQLVINTDKESILLIETPGTNDQGDFHWIVNLYDSNGYWEKVFEYEDPIALYIWNTNESDYLISCLGNPLLFFSKEVGLRELHRNENGDGSAFTISPDQRWVLVKSPDHVWAYDTNAQVVLDFPLSATFIFVRWGPNSDGFFYLEDGRLNYVSLPLGEELVLEPCEYQGCWIYERDLVWFED